MADMTTHRPVLLAFSHICGPDVITGAEKLLLFMLRELQGMYHCRLVVPEEGVLSRKARKYGIETIHLPLPIQPILYMTAPDVDRQMAQLKQLAVWPAVLSLLHIQQPQLVLVNTCVHPLPAMAAKALNIPTVWAMMETIQETPHTAQSASFIYHHTDWILGISSSTLRPFHLAGLADKTTIVFPSWHMEDYQPHSWGDHRASKRTELGFHDGHQVIGYVAASIYKNKGFDHFMNMAVQIASRYPKTMFAVVGTSADAEYVEEAWNQARAAGMLDRFRRVPFEASVQRIYPALDMLIVPSVVPEGFGMTALEGLLFGKPVVAYEAGGLSEIMHMTGNDKNLVPLGTVAGLIKRVSKLLEDDKLMAQIGMRNAYNAQAVFGIVSYRKRLAAFLDVLATRGYTPLRLVRGSSPAVYLLESGRLRPFASEQALLAHGYAFSDVRQVSDELLESFPPGKEIVVPAGEGRKREQAEAGQPAQVSQPVSQMPKGSGTRQRKLSRRKRRKGRRRSVARLRRRSAPVRRAGARRRRKGRKGKTRPVRKVRSAR